MEKELEALSQLRQYQHPNVVEINTAVIEKPPEGWVEENDPLFKEFMKGCVSFQVNLILYLIPTKISADTALYLYLIYYLAVFHVLHCNARNERFKKLQKIARNMRHLAKRRMYELLW